MACPMPHTPQHGVVNGNRARCAPLPASTLQAKLSRSARFERHSQAIRRARCSPNFIVSSGQLLKNRSTRHHRTSEQPSFRAQTGKGYPHGQRRAGNLQASEAGRLEARRITQRLCLLPLLPDTVIPFFFIKEQTSAGNRPINVGARRSGSETHRASRADVRWPSVVCQSTHYFMRSRAAPVPMSTTNNIHFVIKSRVGWAHL
jgi:hypothetical protein